MPEVTVNITEQMDAHEVAKVALAAAEAGGRVTVDKGPRSFKVTKVGDCYKVAHLGALVPMLAHAGIVTVVEQMRDVVPF